MSLRLPFAWGLLSLVVAFSCSEARGTGVAADPATESIATDVAEGQSLDDVDGEALYRDVELAKSTVERASKELEKNPRDVRWLVDRGVAHSATGDFFSALMDFEDATAVDPQSPEPHRALGYVYRIYERPDKALVCYNKAIELGSKSIDSFMSRAAIYYELENFDAACADYDEVIRLYPDHTMAWLGRAMLPHRDWKEAKADYDKTIELSGHAPYAYAYRAQAHFDRGDYDEFCADILAAMKHNPGDVGVEYDPLEEQELTEEDLKFGEEQLRNMLRDRPEMAEWVEEGDELWNWTLRRFAGSAGVRVSWDSRPAEITGGVSGKHADGCGGWIRASAEQHDPSIDLGLSLWATCVFELHNAAYMSGWDAIIEKLHQGAIDREAFLVQTHAWEDGTVQRTRAFYVKFLLPHLGDHDRAEKSFPEQWYCHAYDFITDPEAKKEDWRSGPNWGSYGALFDAEQVRVSINTGQWKEALRLIDKVLAEPANIDSDDFWRAKLWRVHAYAGLGNIESASAQCAEILKECGLDEITGETYYALASLRNYQRQFSDALADATNAVELSPDNIDYRRLKARLYGNLGEHAAALAELEEAASRTSGPPLAEVQFDRATIWLETGELGRAKDALDRALVLDPAGGNSYWLRGRIHQLEARFREALEDYDKAIRFDDRPYYAASKAELLLLEEAAELRNPQQAKEIALRCCEQEMWATPHHIRLLARAHAACEEYDEAIKAEQRAILVLDPSETIESVEAIIRYRKLLEQRAPEPAAAGS